MCVVESWRVDADKAASILGMVLDAVANNIFSDAFQTISRQSAVLTSKCIDDLREGHSGRTGFYERIMTHVAFPRPCCAHQSAKARTDEVSPSSVLFKNKLDVHHHNIIMFKLLRIRDFLRFVHHLSGEKLRWEELKGKWSWRCCVVVGSVSIAATGRTFDTRLSFAHA